MRKWYVGPLFLLAALGFAIVVYPSLPAQVPTHWGMDGQVDDYTEKMPGAFLAPVLGLGIWLLLVGLRRIDPRSRNYDRFDDTFWLIGNVLGVFMAGITVATLGYALGWPIAMERVVLGGVGLLLLVLGNVMPRLRSNFWMGVRTPWTLSSDQVWRDTHRVAGRTMVAGGLITLLALLFPGEYRIWIALAGFVIAGFIPVVYSYFSWRNLPSPPPAP